MVVASGKKAGSYRQQTIPRSSIFVSQAGGVYMPVCRYYPVMQTILLIGNYINMCKYKERETEMSLACENEYIYCN